MAPPTYANGQILNASDCNLWFVPLAAYKTADLGRNINGTSADPDLTVAVAANAFYAVEAALFYKGSAIDVTFQWKFSIPASSGAGLYYASYLSASGLTLLAEADQWADAHTADAPTTGTIYPVFVRGMLATAGSSGSFTLAWGGISATPTVTLTSRSHMTLQRVG
jgi:hypothetical protein